MSKSLKDYVCINPFQYLDVQGDSQWLCCPSWCPQDIRVDQDDKPRRYQKVGPDEDFKKNWQSPQAREVRKSVLDGSYKYCNHQLCPSISQLSTSDELPYNFLKKEEFAEKYGVHSAQDVDTFTGLPREILFGFDRSCNLKCPSCRPEVVKNADPDTEEFQMKNSMMEKIERDFSHSLEEIMVTGSGDPFYSNIYRNFLINFDKAKYPNLRYLKVITNGNLLTEKMWHSLGAKDYIKFIEISIDAGRKETYENITRLNGRWDVLLKNLQFLSTLQHMQHFVFSMVVSEKNFTEMSDLCDLIEGIFKNTPGRTQVNFRQIVHWNAGKYTPNEIRQMSIFEKDHPRFSEFMAELEKIRYRPFVDHNFHHLLSESL